MGKKFNTAMWKSHLIFFTTCYVKTDAKSRKRDELKDRGEAMVPTGTNDIDGET